MKNVLFWLTAAFACPLFSQTYSPITLSGFNLDAVAENYPNSLSGTTQALDQVVAGGNSVMYSAAFGAAASFGGGLPNSGTIVNGAKTFQLMPYTGNNALFVPASSSNTLTLATPASYSNLSFLVFSTEGSSTINISLYYTDLTSTNAGNFVVQDWFNGANSVITGIGRCKRVTSGVTADGLPNNPRFYGIDLALTCANQQKQLAYVVVNGVTSNPAGGGAYVMAISGVTATIPSPSITYPALLCQGGSAATPTLSGSTGGSYASAPAGLSINSGNGAINLIASIPSTYTVTYTSGGTCPVSASYTLSVTPAPTIAVNATTICAGETATLAASGAATYTWTGANLGASSGPSVTASPAATSVYTISGSSNGCSSSTTSTITVNPLPTVTVNSEAICPGEQANLNATASIAGGNFTWLPDLQSTSSIAVSPTSSSNYTVVYAVAGCSDSAVASVNVKPLPVLAVNSGSVCAGKPFSLTASASPAGGSYVWQPGGQGSSSISESPNAPSTYTVSYTLNGCMVSAATGIGIYPNPKVAISTSAIEIAPGDEVVLTGSGGASYHWSTGSTTSQISVKPVETSSYCLTASSAEGCENKTCIEIPVKAESTLYIPNVFTPNGDGLNDKFQVVSYNIVEFDLRIFNRWGQELFHTKDPLQGWDGSVKGQVEAGVYVFVLKAKGNDGTAYQKSGHITLLR